MSTLEQDGEEVVGQARCPFESRQSNVGLFAGELLWTETERHVSWGQQLGSLNLSSILPICQ